MPTLNDVLGGPRYDVISIGFVLALWSGSRALNVFVDTVTIMYGLGGHRGIVKTRMLSFSLYVLGLLTGIVTIPLVVAGPTLVDRALPDRLDALNSLYWPVVVVICVVFTATLYHVSVPVRTSWRYNLPGAALTLVIWIAGSAVLRWVLTATAGGLDLDLRPAGGTDRDHDLALHPRDRRAHRRRAQRLLRRALARVRRRRGRGSSWSAGCGPGPPCCPGCAGPTTRRSTTRRSTTRSWGRRTRIRIRPRTPRTTRATCRRRP